MFGVAESPRELDLDDEPDWALQSRLSVSASPAPSDADEVCHSPMSSAAEPLVDCQAVFVRLTKYIAQRHSNLQTVFLEYDRNGTGTLILHCTT